MKAFKSKQGFLLIELTANELMNAVHSNIAICDSCGKISRTGYYVPVLNRWLCPDCCNSWLKTAKYYKEDAEYELKKFNYMMALLKLTPSFEQFN